MVEPDNVLISGDVVQNISPFTAFMSPIGSQFGLINITLGQSSAPAVESDVFFTGDSAGHCLPTTAEGIRTALYFGIALGRELRGVLEGRQSRAAALGSYAAFSAAGKYFK